MMCYSEYVVGKGNDISGRLVAEESYHLARRRIVNNALRRRQKSLDLRNKSLAALPPEIGQLTELRVLLLSGNQLTALPPEIGQLSCPISGGRAR
jgi:Leucine-rich repeat (LRR) protein